MKITDLADINYKIHNIKVLNKDDKKAYQILLRVAEQIMPIMKKRSWSILTLSEFLPKNKKLLGLYISQFSEIKIRLRWNKGDNIFHFNVIIGTLLHELAHIVCKRHDKKFYELLNELIYEYNMIYFFNKIKNGRKIGCTDANKEYLKTKPQVMAAKAAEKRLLETQKNKTQKNKTQKNNEIKRNDDIDRSPLNYIEECVKNDSISENNCITIEEAKNIYMEKNYSINEIIFSIENGIIVIEPNDISNKYINNINSNLNKKREYIVIDDYPEYNKTYNNESKKKKHLNSDNSSDDIIIVKTNNSKK